MVSKFRFSYREVFDKLRRNRHIKFGLPFVFFVGLAFLGLREFQSVRYEFRKCKPLDKDEAELRFKVKRPESPEEAYEKLNTMDLDNWENVRGPKYFYDYEGKIQVRVRVMMELICATQNYHWGKTGRNSLVAKVASANSGVVPAEDEPFAEFWMGTHPNGPSYIKTTKTTLSQHISLHSNELGDKVITHFGIQLPFLFKVLSVEKPLSIQAHPTKSHAEDLFQKFPQIYKDGNHKPEIAIAVTNFEALCGFRPLSEIKNFLRTIEEFKILIDLPKINDFLNCSDNEENERILMKSCFQSLMSCKGDVFATAIEKLLARFQTLTPSEEEEYLVSIVKRLCDSFPKDVGIFCVYWLNYIVLLPREALYLAPNEPHAYLYGDCLECMANSDNVVRAGLTPKFRDIETLCQMLTYKSYRPSEIIFHPIAEDEFCLLYSPPVKDFAVAKISLPKDKKYHLKKRDSASILLVLSGKGKLNSAVLEFGKVFFIPCGHESWIDSEGLVMFQAFCNV